MPQLALFSPFEDPEDSVSHLATPAYQIRESKRAKHVSIKISVEGEVEVVVPPKFDRKQLPGILEKKQDWIAKTRSRLTSDRAQTSSDWQAEKPETIALRWQSTALDDPNQPGSAGPSSADPSDLEIWSVAYQPSAGNKTLCIPSLGDRLTIRGNTEHLPACQAVLRKWLAHRAQRDLTPWLRQLGFELDLPCRRISVRGQKTRWASCSNHKDISLNYKLLFLPRPLVHYVLVHELCHTVHMNHSAKFWRLVGEKQPDYQQWRDQLKTGWRYVPRWVET
ncbi:SprT family zinc-dependent metalloprotease [Leptolyngbya sp. BC1307]|uniref:M48 family metallopeptidase n=1 Tax=Leptolyngbya sp. BC1307 TaxID=2029589 RepID=UPI000EFBE3BF|nr:SprT family zinc-dependent metalloprotease [Leptolyngbya sp. BC1307]